MRIFVTPYCWLTLVVAFAWQAASADLIHLKNGDVIYADEAKEVGSRLQYEVGDDTYTLPKSVVQNVDKRVERPRVSTAHASELPAYAPATSVAGEGPLLSRVVVNGQVNREALLSIESRGNPPEIAVAFYIAGKQEFQGGKYAEARRDFEAALHQDPQNPAILNFYAALLVKTGNAPDGILYAERAVRLAPDSADALAVLGFAQYSADRSRDAIQSWKRSLALRPDTSIQAMIDRAQRESAAENNYSERDTGHFVLHYEGARSSEAFRAQMLSTLESEYAELARGFGVE
ncbi:MAG TPA: tetratricopeptide repeat protein, partial [Terriglobales bacterium]